MAILVTMQVGPVDPAKFKAAVDWMDQHQEPGQRSSTYYHSESDPKTVLVMQEWDDHDTFHAASDKYGDEFNARAGTEGLDWITGVWVKD